MKSATIWPMVLLALAALFVLAVIVADDSLTNTDDLTIETVTATASPVRLPTPEALTNESNDGFLTGHRTGLASMLALGAFALLAVGGARAATRRR